jgi:adenine-specific DNA-methyltransferase
MSNYRGVLEKLSKIVESNQKYKIEDAINKNLLAEDARKYNPDLLNLLQKDGEIKNHFFTEIDGGLIFKKDIFLQFINNKEFLPDSYTKYKIKVGLGVADGKLLSESGDVVLNWPYKDTILEGGQDKEDQKRKEIFFNEVLAPDQISRLLDNKVFTNWKRVDADGERNLDEFKDDDNLIIKGNNLVVLHSIKKRYAGKVKLIYIDPPYNTGSDSFGYNDNFNHSTWLTFMKNRLEVAKKLLANDGSIFVQCDDKEQAYLKVMMDEIFGRDNFINLITVKTKIGGVTGSSEGKSFKDTTEFINVFCRNKGEVGFNNIPQKTPLDEYIQGYKDEGKSWKYTSVITKLDDKKLIVQDDNYSMYSYGSFETMSVSQFAKKNNLSEDKVYKQFDNKIFRTTNAQSSVRKTVIKRTEGVTNKIVSIEYSPSKGKNKGKLIEIFYKDEARNMLMFLSDNTETVEGQKYYLEKISTLWEDIQYNNLAREGGVNLPNGKKPEALIKRIIELSTDKDDLVLDYHVGSGTTAAVAHKMGRQYIGIEQLFYGDNDPILRLKNVINGDQTGISKDVSWQGGGSFVYANIMNNANKFRERVERAKNDTEYLKLLEEASSSSFLSYRVDPTKLNESDFRKLSSAEKRRLLLELIDNNTLYVNYEDINDPIFGVSEADKSFNKELYK